MHVHRHRVHTHRVRDQVQQLPAGADRMRPAKPERVVEVPIDALGIVAPLVQRLEVRITGWDLADLLGPVELPLPILVVGVQSSSPATGVQPPGWS